MRHFNTLILLAFVATAGMVSGQTKDSDKGQFSGNLLMNYQKYLRDDSIGANTKVYKENTASADAWLFMQYRMKGYSFIVRYDAFNNSPLLTNRRPGSGLACRLACARRMASTMPSTMKL